MENFEGLIDKVLSGELRSVNSTTLIAPTEVDRYLQSNKLEKGNFESNGWDWDFWMEYFLEDKKFILAGSGWYNTGLTFYAE